MRKNVTLNLGVRYEYNSVPQEAHNLLGNFDPNACLVQVGHGISSLYSPDHSNFGPRIGIAWRPFGNFVTRAGYGIFYDMLAVPFEQSRGVG